MFRTFLDILKDNWNWRSQLFELANLEIVKMRRGSALGWVWILLKPIIYLVVFWFAMDLGLKGGRNIGGDYPYILWLASGILPWFFMQKMLGTGSRLYSSFSHLVNKIKFPLPVISSFYALSELYIHLVLLVLLGVFSLIVGVRYSIYLLQLPLVIILMYVFWVLFSMMTSPLSATSKDLRELIRVISTPLFWLSGIIYEVSTTGIVWFEQLMRFNPIHFFVNAYRASTCKNFWIFTDPTWMVPFAIVFLLTFICALRVQQTVAKDVADTL